MSRERTVDVVAEMVANVMTVGVEVGDAVAAGDSLILLESRKKEIPVLAETAGSVLRVRVSPGDVVQEGDILLTLSVR